VTDQRDSSPFTSGKNEVRDGMPRMRNPVFRNGERKRYWKTTHRVNLVGRKKAHKVGDNGRGLPPVEGKCKRPMSDKKEAAGVAEKLQSRSIAQCSRKVLEYRKKKKEKIKKKKKQNKGNWGGTKKTSARKIGDLRNR